MYTSITLSIPQSCPIAKKFLHFTQIDQWYSLSSFSAPFQTKKTATNFTFITALALCCYLVVIVVIAIETRISSYRNSTTSTKSFLGLDAGVSFAIPKEIAPTNCPFISMKSTNSLYAKQVFAIHNVPYPNSVAVNNIF